MFKKIALILCLVLVSTAAMALYQYEQTDLAPRIEKQEIHFKDSGKLIYTQEREVRTSKYDDQNFYIVTAVDTGQGEFKGEVKKMTAYYKLDYGFKKTTITAHQKITDTFKNDKLVHSRQLDYNWDNMKASLTIKKIGKDKTDTKTKTFKLKKDMIDSQDSGMYIAYVVDNKLDEFDFDMIAPNGVVYRMRAKAKYLDNDDDGSADEAIVKMKPTGLLGLIAPTLTFKFDKVTDSAGKASFDFKEYLGPQSSPTSPYVIQTYLGTEYIKN